MLKSKPRLPPLTPKDIMLVRLQQEPVSSKTDALRQLLVRNRVSQPQIIIPTRPIRTTQRTIQSLNLPERFTILEENQLVSQELTRLTQRNYTNLLTLQFAESQSTTDQSIREYQQLLEGVREVLTQVIDKHHTTTSHGKQQIQSLNKVICAQLVRVQELRIHYADLQAELTTKAMQIMRLVNKRNNKKQVLQAMQLWKETIYQNLPYFQPSNLFVFGIATMLKKISETRAKLKANLQEYRKYECFDKIGNFLKTRQTRLIELLEQKYENSILNFESSQEYEKVFRNSQQMIKDVGVGKDCFANINLLIQNNLNKIVKDTLGRMDWTTLNQVQKQTADRYLDFYVFLIQRLQEYLKNWHLTIRWHLDNQSQQTLEASKKLGEELLRNRKKVWEKVTEKVAEILRKSERFFRLQIKQKIQLVSRLQIFWQKGNFFCNWISPVLPKVIKQKISEDRNQLCILVRDMLRNALTKQFSVKTGNVKQIQATLPNSEVYELSESELVKLRQFMSAQQYNMSTSGVFQVDVAKPSTQPILFDHMNQQTKEIRFSQQYGPSCHTIRAGSVEIAKYTYFLPETTNESFSKTKQIVELYIYVLFYRFTPEPVRQFLFQDWQAYNSYKVNQLRDLEVNCTTLDYFLQVYQRQNQHPLLAKNIPTLCNKLASLSISPQPLPYGDYAKMAGMTQPALDLAAWIKQNIRTMYRFGSESVLTKITQQANHLSQILRQLVHLLRKSHVEEARAKYLSLAPMLIELKWDLKKYTNQTAYASEAFKKQYVQVLSNVVSSIKYKISLKANTQSQDAINSSMAASLELDHVQLFFQCLTELCSRIEKMNENGRQLLRIDIGDIAKAVDGLGVNSTDSPNRLKLEQFLDLLCEKDNHSFDKIIAQQILSYPLRTWKNFANTSAVGQGLSSRERKQFMFKIGNTFYDALNSARLRKS